MSQPTQLTRAYDEVIAFFASGPNREQVASFRLSPTAIKRVRDLRIKNSAGTLSADEADELDQCAYLNQLMTLIRTHHQN